MVTDNVRHDRTIELWHRTIADAAPAAVLLGAGIEEAHRISGKAFRRASWLWMERRDGKVYETWLLRLVVRAVGRRRRWRRFVRLASGGRLTGSGSLVPEADAELWNRLQEMRLRHTAAVVLANYRGLGVQGVADVLQTSAAGATALLARAMKELGDDPTEGADISRLITRVGDRVPLPDRDRMELDRTHLMGRLGGVAVAAVMAVALVSGGLLVASFVSETREPTVPERSVQIDGEGALEIPASELLGAPGWCPSTKGMLPLRAENGEEAIGVASRLNLGLINGYESSVGHLFERPRGAPNPFSWSTTTDDVRLRIVSSVPAEANRVLAANCGSYVARRSWEVILEHTGPPHHDGVAFFLVRRADGMNVWGTYAGSAQ